MRRVRLYRGQMVPMPFLSALKDFSRGTKKEAGRDRRATILAVETQDSRAVKGIRVMKEIIWRKRYIFAVMAILLLWAWWIASRTGSTIGQ